MVDIVFEKIYNLIFEEIYYETPVNKNSEIFRAAAELLDKRGMAREVFKHKNGKMCLIGAVRQAKHGNTLVRIGADCHAALQNVTVVSPEVFNDEYARTKRDLIAVLHIAADIEQTKGN